MTTTGMKFKRPFWDNVPRLNEYVHGQGSLFRTLMETTTTTTLSRMEAIRMRVNGG